MFVLVTMTACSVSNVFTHVFDDIELLGALLFEDADIPSTDFRAIKLKSLKDSFVNGKISRQLFLNNIKAMRKRSQTSKNV